MPGPLQQDEPATELAGQVRSHRGVDLGVLGPVDDQDRAADPRAERGHLRRVEILVPQPRNPARIVSMSVSSAQPTQSSICLVECGSVKHWAKKNSRYPGQSRSQ